jgi:hypothetical protein
MGDVLKNSELIVATVSAIAAIIACFLAYCIPKRIMGNQLFADLVAEYRKPEMGGAILSLFYFYDECKRNKKDINCEYKKIYERQIKSKLPVITNLCAIDNETTTDMKINFADTLHFQRRLAAQFYTDMADLYAEHSCYCSLIKKINNWFTPKELQLLKIILLLSKPSGDVFINVDVSEELPDIDVQMYKSIRNLYFKVSKHIKKISDKH